MKTIENKERNKRMWKGIAFLSLYTVQATGKFQTNLKLYHFLLLIF